MAKVGFNDTILLGTAAESRYLLTQYALDNTSKLTRNSATEAQVEAQTGRRNFLVVNGEIVSLSSAKTCTTSTNLLASDGTDSGNPPGASTLYYCYLGNSSASWGASTFKWSATSPSADANGILYLATSGNGHNWRFVGAVQLNGSTQIGDDFAICGYGKNRTRSLLTSRITKSSGSSGEYVAQTIDCVVLVNTNVKIISQIAQDVNSATILENRIAIDTVEKCRDCIFGLVFGGQVQHDFISSSIAKNILTNKYYYTTGTTLNIYENLDVWTWLEIARETE